MKKALISVAAIKDRLRVIQLRSHGRSLENESKLAVRYGANIVMIDTGGKEDITTVSQILNKAKLRERVKLAYAGNIKLSDIPKLQGQDLDIVDIGRAIVDAPLLDMRLEVVR